LEKTTKPLIIILNRRMKYNPIKLNIVLSITFIKANEDKEQVGYFQSKAKRFIYGRSGWTIKSVDKHIIIIVKYTPLRGSSYLPLPTVIKNRKGLINIKNEKDNECCRWCHLAYIFPAQKNPQRITKYKKIYRTT
ncbi:hypothetical protein MAR_019696, partial [Mya arenaria]